MVHGTDSVSGGEMVSFSLISGLKKEMTDAEIRFFQPDGKGIFAAARSLARILENKDRDSFGHTKAAIDIVHAHGTRASVIVKLAFLFTRVRPTFVYTIHGIHFAHRGFLRKNIGCVFEYVSNRLYKVALVCVGNSDFHLAKKLQLAPKAHIYLVPNGVADASLRPKQESDQDTKSDTLHLITAVRFHYQKDTPTLLRAMHYVADSRISLDIVGSGSEFVKLKHLAERLQLKNVTFLGRRNDVPELLAQADIAILSTRWEGLPLFLLEALALAKPIIASDVHGVRDVVGDDTHQLFEMGNAKQLALRITALAADSNLRKHIGAKNRLRYVDHFTEEAMVKSYKKLYAELIHA